MILIDIQMPITDGYEATRQIRQFNDGITIIAQTAYTFNREGEQALAAGCNDFISKPVKIDKLNLLLQKYFKI